MAWPLRGAKHHHAKTLLGCVTFTERVSKNPWSLGKYAYSSFHVQVQAYLMR